MTSRIDRYRECASICAATLYDSGASVRRHNAAVTVMRCIVVEPNSAEDLQLLLDEPESAQWLAFQLLELCNPSDDIREKCLATIRELAAGSNVTALGAAYWLRDFKG